jgi:glycosyltransferase involved in cell wall biosynthesis
VNDWRKNGAKEPSSFACANGTKCLQFLRRRLSGRFFWALGRRCGVVVAMGVSGREPLSILFTHYGEPWIRGSEQVLIDLTTSLDRSRFNPVIWCNEAPLADIVEKAGLTVYRQDFTSFFNYGSPRFNASRYLSFVAEGLKIVKTHRVGLLHSNGAAPHQWLVPVSLRARLPLLAHLHTNYLRRERFASLLHQATAIVGVSQSVARDFLTDGVPENRVKVIHNGIVPDRFRPERCAELRKTLGIGEDAIVVASVGSLIERKGMDLLVRSLARLRDPNIHLVIAGEGPQRSALQRLAADLSMQSHVHFLGYCADISPVYATADIAALASRAEAFGLAAAEAGYFSLPVVAHNLPGVGEVIENGRTGLLVPVENVEALARALQQLAADPEKRKNMGAAGKDRVLQRFSVHRMVSSFEALYEDLVDQADTAHAGARIALRPYFQLFGNRYRKNLEGVVPLA